MGKETIEMRECPGCGAQVRFRVVDALHGEKVYIHLHEPHKAPDPCGRSCYEGRDIAMQHVLAGVAHHPRECACLKEGRGYV